MSKTIKIILADDEELFRKGIYFLLQREKNIEIVFEASNGNEVIEYLKKTDSYPDIILMDLKMPFVSGIDATKIIHKEFPVVKIIALTSYNTKAFIANMINVGASSYLVKSATPKEMIETINKVAQKGFYYNEAVLQVIQDDIIATDKSMINLFDQEYLTVREKEVLELICMQFSTHEIAEKLSISSRTVEGHRNNLLLKTESKNIAGLVVYAIQKKVVVLDTF
ncbi:response regulator transcription factor [Flavobacterium sp.]|uniref:response regulator transcription factor n=1 Tax=Flavobacterium sp. TaxID=239 RepID=UPI000EEEFAE9|nr:response regulator transcription factor [Flavobacterium sp.]HCQ13275.1 DNA-binding response regulator [Flavobacterium sp.]